MNQGSNPLHPLTEVNMKQCHNSIGFIHLGMLVKKYSN